MKRKQIIPLLLLLIWSSAIAQSIYGSAYVDDNNPGTESRTFVSANGDNDRTNENSPVVTRQAPDYPTALGAFIQGWLVAHWNDNQWQKEFAALKEAGMSYMVLAPALQVDRGNSFSLYPSDIPGVTQMYENDIIDNCLRNAQEAGFKVFIGLNMDEEWWVSWNNLEPDWFYSKMRVGNLVADELISKYKNLYPEAFYGWYWVWEVANVGELYTEKYQDYIANSLNINLDHLSLISPSMPMMLCPFMNYRIGTSDEYRIIWENIFAKTHFRAGDIFAPQDCVGAGGLEIDMVDEWFSALRNAVSTKPGLLLWSDTETFDQRFWTSATLDLFVRQMELVKPYVSGIMTFTYSHYYSPITVTNEFHEAYVNYYKTGELPEIPAPQPVKTLWIENGETVKLKWEEPDDLSGIVGYNIYRNDELIGRVQYNAEKKCNTEWNVEYVTVSDYKVFSYNCIGIESGIYTENDETEDDSDEENTDDDSDEEDADDDSDEEDTDDDSDEEDADDDSDEEDADDDSDEEDTDDVSNEITEKQLLSVYSKGGSVSVVSGITVIKEIKIYSMQGVELYHSNVNDRSHTVFNSFPPGMYIVTVKTNNGVISKKIIINQ